MKKVWIVIMSAVLILLATGLPAQLPDSKVCKDHQLVPHAHAGIPP